MLLTILPNLPGVSLCLEPVMCVDQNVIKHCLNLQNRQGQLSNVVNAVLYMSIRLIMKNRSFKRGRYWGPTLQKLCKVITWITSMEHGKNH